MMFKRKKKKTGCETHEFRKPTVPPQYKAPPMPPVQPPKPPTSGSNAFKPSSVQPVKKPCLYETPCGWCTKWDKKCDLKPYKRGLRVLINPIDDAIGVQDCETLTNTTCKSEEDHEWECCGVSTAGTDYRCKKCYAHKSVPYETKPIAEYLTSSLVAEDIISNVIKENKL